MKHSAAVEEILRTDGLLARRQHLELASAIDWYRRRGDVVSVLPSVYAAAGTESDLWLRARAVALWDPDAVITRHAAAKLSYWPDAPLVRIEVAVPDRGPRRPGFSFTRRRIPPELVMTTRGVQITTPALTAVDLATLDDAAAIDIALRKRVVTLESLHDAVAATPGRPGNVDRRLVLLDSRAQPWSQAERRCHRLLRAAGIAGWQANMPFTDGEGRLFYLDVAFRAARLAIEIDGLKHLNDRAVFENDRWRQNSLVLAGWRVLRFTWSMLVDHPDHVIATIRAALAMT